MLKFLGIAAVILVIAAAAILAYAAARPDDFKVSRTVAIEAAPERIFPLIANLRQMNEWNPFAKQDPALEIVYSGPDSGVGAAQSWDSTGRGGKGRLEITGVTEPTAVAMRLDMDKPIEAHNAIAFDLRPNGEATEVTWTMTGGMPFVSKVIGVFVSMDRMIGGAFEQGLADLKALAEK